MIGEACEVENHDEGKDHLLEMPSLVCDNVLKYLTGKELLSLRRVCKATKSWVSGSNRKVWDGYQLEIRSDFEGWQTFEAAVRSRLNVTSIFINNPGDEGMDIYNSPGLISFIHAYGPHIQKLKVQSFGTFLTDNEFNFFESLTNLRELKLQVVDARRRPLLHGEVPLRFPNTFRNLRVLKFGNIMSPVEAPYRTEYHWYLVRLCPFLEFLRFPVASCDYEYPAPEGQDNYYDPMMNYMKSQQRILGSLRLHTLDLKYVIGDVDLAMSTRFPYFLWFIYLEFKDAIQLLNAHVEMLFEDPNAIHPMAPFYRDCCNNLITSMTNLLPCVRFLELPHLSKLIINSTACSGFFQDFGNDPDWPKLNSISIIFDGGNEALSTLTDFLFKDKYRPSVHKLSIVYDEDVCNEPSLNGLISSRALARNFENLKFLEMVRWNVKNVSFLKLWEGLTQLEELTIEDCSTFGNVALIGQHLDEPIFLKLRKLEKLRLKMDRMQLLTDRAFHDVFSRMELKEFHIQCLDPLEKVTEAGIVSLLKGPFGRTIEKFPFTGWSLASMSFMQFRNLGKQFRSIC